jgi:hypothetical protein
MTTPRRSSGEWCNTCEINLNVAVTCEVTATCGSLLYVSATNLPRLAKIILKDNRNHSYVFILNLVNISAPLPFEIIPEHFLDRASPDFIAAFRKF